MSFFNKIHGSLQRGIMSVAGASLVNKMVAFVSNILVVRFVTQSEYGLYSSAYNIISLVMLITGAGTINGVLQYGSENRKETEKKRYFRYSFIFGIAFDLVLTLLVCLYANFGFLPLIDAKKYVFMLVPTIILHYVFEYLGAIVRSKKDAEKYAVMMNINSISNSLLSCIGAYKFGVEGIIIGRNFAYILGIAVGLYYNRKIIQGIICAERIENKQKRELIYYSASCCIIAALNRILYIIDVTIISYIVKDANEVAIYKVGTQIPEALEFIPYSILIAVMPYFAEHNSDEGWLKKWTKKLYAYSGLLNLGITVLLILFAPIIINLFWGEQYKSSTPIFIMLSINYFVMATFRQTGTNILSALREVKYNIIISCATCVVNIILDVIFVYKWGIYGASAATVIVVIFASLLSFPYVYKLIYAGGKK